MKLMQLTHENGKEFRLNPATIETVYSLNIAGKKVKSEILTTAGDYQCLESMEAVSIMWHDCMTQVIYPGQS